MPTDRPLIVGIGGSASDNSTTSRLLTAALDHAASRGARTAFFDGPYLATLPHFIQDGPVSDSARGLVDAVAGADGLIVATPGYHGGYSGLVKNALDYLELLRDDPHPYLTGRAVGLIVSAAGVQACGTTLMSLRSVVHALRGWPTPYGAAINTSDPVVEEGGRFAGSVVAGVRLVADQVMEFVSWRRAKD